MTSLPQATVRELLADLGWVRTLARALARDGHDADDLAQDACLAALQSPPPHDHNVRGWFQRVLANLVRQGERSRWRRYRREATLAGERAGAAAAPADELAERAAVHRAVGDAVLALEQPYRDTMLLRWFEDLPPRAIAARTGVPVATVHSRLQRGAELLRARLDRGFGSRRAWAAAFVSLPVPFSLPVLGVVVMNVKAVAAGTVLVVGATLWWATGSSASPGPVLRNEATAPPAAPPAHTEPVADARTEATPTPATTAPPAAAAPAPAGRTLAGHVVDSEGRAAAGVSVRLGDTRATGDAAGAFQLTLTAGQGGNLRSDDARWRTVMQAVVTPGSVVAPLVVVGAAIDVTGEVRSGDGAPVANATVRAVWPDDLRSRLSAIADTSTEDLHTDTSGADATFALASAAVRGASLLVTAEGFATHREPLPERSVAGLRIVLERPVAKPGSIQGTVLDLRGAPVANASVGLGGALRRTDERGDFLLDDDGKGKAVAAVAAGHRRAALPRPAGGFPPFVVLTLGDVPLAIRGTVVDATGNAVKDARVWCVDPTLLCESRDPVTVEGLAAGVRAGGRSGPSAFWPFVTTAGDGSFELGGLDDRAYTLRAMEDETLTRADVPSIAAGTSGVRIVLPTGERFERLAGTVVTRGGAPVPGVNLTVQSDPHSLRGRTMHARAVARATSGSDGRFFLPKVPHRAVYLRLDGDTILPLEYGRDVAGGLLELAAGSPEDLRLVVAVRVHVQVELLDPASADAIRVLDGDGRALIVNVFEGRGRRETDELELPGGKSPVFVVPDSAATLVLAKAGKEVRREPLQLRPGAVNTLRL